MILLTSTEKKIFNLLKQCRMEIDPSKMIEFRVVGGWVRDKLLGIESKDIDITIRNIALDNFIESFRDFLSKNEIYVKGFGNIKKNEQKGKNMSITTFKLEDIWVDFVELRSDPRIMTLTDLHILKTASKSSMDQTPLLVQDAHLRDLTLNSLFFNLDSEQVEDWTELGVGDLQNGILRTPLRYQTTFYDDPLRVLRSIRFMLKYGFRFENQLAKSLNHDDNLRKLFLSNVTRERVGKEIEGCFAHVFNKQNADKTLLAELWSMGYFAPIFLGQLQENFSADHPLIASRKPLFERFGIFANAQIDLEGLVRISLHLERVISGFNANLFLQKIQHEAEKPKPVKFVLGLKTAPAKHVLGSIFIGFTFLPFAGDPKLMLNKQLLSQILQTNLKISNKFVLYALEIQSSILKIKHLANLLATNLGDPDSKVLELGLWVKHVGCLWGDVLELALMAGVVSAEDRERVCSVVIEWQLEKVLTRKVFLDGKAMRNQFGLVGKQIKDGLDYQEKWMILNPNKSVEEFIFDFKKSLKS